MGDTANTDGGVNLSQEVRSVSLSGAAKGIKPENFALIPVGPLQTLARIYGRGAEKYHETPDNPNWRKGYEWSKAYSALMRHATQFWGGEDIDQETGLPHMAAVAFHAFSLLEFMEEHREYDDRFKNFRCAYCGDDINNGLHDLSDPKLGHK